MLAQEFNVLNNEETTADDLATKIILEYVRQHFDESTKAVARLLSS